MLLSLSQFSLAKSDSENEQSKKKDRPELIFLKTSYTIIVGSPEHPSLYPVETILVNTGLRHKKLYFKTHLFLVNRFYLGHDFRLNETI